MLLLYACIIIYIMYTSKKNHYILYIYSRCLSPCYFTAHMYIYCTFIRIMFAFVFSSTHSFLYSRLVGSRNSFKMYITLPTSSSSYILLFSSSYLYIYIYIYSVVWLKHNCLHSSAKMWHFACIMMQSMPNVAEIVASLRVFYLLLDEKTRMNIVIGAICWY